MVKQAGASSSDLSFDLSLEIAAAEQTGFSRASDPAGAVMEGLLDLKDRYGTIPSSVFLAAAAYGSADGEKLKEQVPPGDADGELELGEWVEYKLATQPPSDGGRDRSSRDAGAADRGGKRDLPGAGKDQGGPGADADEGGCGCLVRGARGPGRGAPAALLLPVLFAFLFASRRRGGRTGGR
jgi:hypothetical protein